MESLGLTVFTTKLINITNSIKRQWQLVQKRLGTVSQLAFIVTMEP